MRVPAAQTAMLSSIQTVPFQVSFGVLKKEMGQSDEREGLLILLCCMNSGQSVFYPQISQIFVLDNSCNLFSK
jgi:hypothetical protein